MYPLSVLLDSSRELHQRMKNRGHRRISHCAAEAQLHLTCSSRRIRHPRVSHNGGHPCTAAAHTAGRRILPARPRIPRPPDPPACPRSPPPAPVSSTIPLAPDSNNLDTSSSTPPSQHRPQPPLPSSAPVACPAPPLLLATEELRRDYHARPRSRDLLAGFGGGSARTKLLAGGARDSAAARGSRLASLGGDDLHSPSPRDYRALGNGTRPSLDLATLSPSIAPRGVFFANMPLSRRPQ